MSFKRLLIWSSGDPLVQWSGTIYTILVDGIIGFHSCYIILNLDRWFRRCGLMKKLTHDGHMTYDAQQTTDED